jgi:hypothetical protein
MAAQGQDLLNHCLLLGHLDQRATLTDPPPKWCGAAKEAVAFALV